MLACHEVAPRSGRCIQSCLDTSGWCRTALQLSAAWCTGFVLKTHVYILGTEKMLFRVITDSIIRLKTTCGPGLSPSWGDSYYKTKPGPRLLKSIRGSTHLHFRHHEPTLSQSSSVVGGRPDHTHTLLLPCQGWSC